MNDEVLGGWYDAGDHVKFNLPMAYSAQCLAGLFMSMAMTLRHRGRDFILKGTLPLPLTILLPATEVTVSLSDR